MSEDVYEMLDSYSNQQKKVSFKPPKFGKKKDSIMKKQETIPEDHNENVEEEKQNGIQESSISVRSSKDKSMKQSFPLDNLFTYNEQQNHQPELFDDPQFNNLGNVDDLNLEFQGNEGIQDFLKDDDNIQESDPHDISKNESSNYQSDLKQNKSLNISKQQQLNEEQIGQIQEHSEEEEDQLQQIQSSIHDLSNIIMAEKENSPNTQISHNSPPQKKPFLNRPRNLNYSFQSPKGLMLSRNESSQKSIKKKQDKIILQIEMLSESKKILINLHNDSTTKTLKNQIVKQVPQCQNVEKLVSRCIVEISEFTTKLRSYLEAKQLKDIRSYKFSQYAKENPQFLEKLCQPNESNKQSTRQLYLRDKSVPNIKQKISHQRNNTELDFFNGSVSPNCSKQLKVSALMNEPPNISTWKECNTQGIKIISNSFKSNVLTLEIEYGIGQKGKIQLNIRKVDEEMKTKVLQSQLIKIPTKQKKNYFESKEILNQIDKFCIRHKLDAKQKIKLTQILNYDNIQQYIKKE